ncbi:MAG: hypothetical protein GXP25_02885 [Planctomycetes bacterium]|nr:hypothetical protein [Planctomycetota bacterium]
MNEQNQQSDALPVARLLRYGRQVVMRAMERTRFEMRGGRRLAMKEVVEGSLEHKSVENPTKQIDKEIENDIIASLRKKLGTIAGLPPYAIFSEECGILACGSEAGSEQDARFVIFVDPVDGTEFAEALQGGWCLLGFYDAQERKALGAIAGDIFLDRLFWTPDEFGRASALDFITHSEFHLDCGPEHARKTRLKEARINVLTTKPSRYRALATQERLMAALQDNDCRINLSWGSNTLIQLAAGYADAAVEFARGFAAYDVLPGLILCRAAGACLLDLAGNDIDIDAAIDIDDIFDRYRKDPTHPRRLPFVAATTRPLAEELVGLLDMPDDGGGET